MKSFKLNKVDNDLEFDSIKNLRMVDDIDEVKQRLRLTLTTNTEEWFLNLKFGYPWFPLLPDNAPPERFKREVVKILDNDPAVVEILDIDVDFDRRQRELRIDYTCRTDEEKFSERVVI